MIARIVAACLSLLAAGAASAQTCRTVSMTEERLAAWYNPHPAADDFTLPLPPGLALVFTPAPLGTTGLYGDERTTYQMGSSKPEFAETELTVRVGSSMTDESGQTRLLIGKYEVTKAQYAAVLGRGNLRAGMEILRERTKDTRVRAELDEYLEPGRPCSGKFSGSLHTLLSEPITFLSYRDYIEFLDNYNLMCISRRDCRAALQSLGANRDIPGFVRLPTEHEWEFVARGGRDLVAGRLTKNEMQRDLPAFDAGESIAAHAHFGNDPPRVMPIGSRKPLFGMYDVYGNAQELMANAYTAENGFGAVGAYVARGGHFGLDASELRASRRVELLAFRMDDATGLLDIQYFPRTGLRLAIGLPIAGAAERLGDSSLSDDFDQNYVRPEDAGDTAGNTQAEARDLGLLGERGLAVSERIDGDDTEDWFAFRLADFARMEIEVEGGAGLEFTLLDERQRVLGQRQGPGVIKTQDIVPADYFLRVTPARNSLRDEIRFSVTASRSLALDTGIARLEAGALTGGFVLSRTNRFSVDGFVGRGDTIDTYPLVNRSGHEAVEVVVTADAPLDVSSIGADGGLIQRETLTPDGSGDAATVLGFPNRAAAFLQIEANLPAQSAYRLVARGKAPYDPIFLTAYSDRFSESARVGKTYEGRVSGRQKLYLPIRLTSRRTLTVELSGLDEDVDMSVIGSSRRVVTSSHSRSGNQPEFFSEVLEEGPYVVAIGLKSGTSSSAFQVRFREEEPPQVALDPEELLRLARTKAASLGSLSATPTTRSEFIREPEFFYRFNVPPGGPRYVQIDLWGFQAGDDFDMTLESSSGSVEAKSANVGATPEKIAETLSPGTYYIRLSRTGSATSSSFYLSASAMSQMSEPRDSWWGGYVETHEDYTIYRNGDECNAVTIARVATPSLGWRPEKPYMRVGVDRGSDRVGIHLDVADEDGGTDLFQSGSVRAEVVGRGAIPAEFERRWLKPLTRCSVGKCVDSDAVRAFRRGRELVIRGRTPDGESATIRYSLLGYTRAMQRINQICGGRANWIWNK